MALGRAHVDIHAIAREVDEVLARDVSFGPKRESPYDAILASHHALPEVLAQLDRFFGIGRRDELLAIRDRMREALGLWLEAWRSAPGVNTNASVQKAGDAESSAHRAETLRRLGSRPPGA